MELLRVAPLSGMRHTLRSFLVSFIILQTEGQLKTLNAPSFSDSLLR